MNLRNLFAELKRRNVPRAALAYAATAWLLIQIATQTLPFFDTPQWVVRAIIVVLLAGFPFAIAWAWMFEVTAAGIVRTEEVPRESSETRATGRKLNLIIIGVLGVLVALLLFDRFRPAPSAVTDKSIAVLPLANLSDDKENAFFADGMQDDILTSLSKIADLRVISRTSVMGYRGGGKRNLRDIGKALGAGHIMEGSVRRSADRVVVNVQLIDARNDHQVWAQRYDRKLSDALGLQGELAGEIADALRAKFSPEEKARVETKPTHNADAYLLYLRARQFELSPDTLLQDYKQAEQLYAQAVALDSSFALAQARLAITRGAIFHYYEPLELWKTKMSASAQQALRLQPNLSEAHAALGLYYYWTERNYERALPELSTAQRLSPSEASIASAIAAIRRRQGQWDDALDLYQRALSLDPQNVNVVRNLFYTLTAMRDWPAAARIAQRMRKLVPDAVNSNIQAGYVEFSWKGSTDAIKATLNSVPLEVDPDGFVTAARWDVSMIDRDYGAAAEALSRSLLGEFSYLNAQATPKAYLEGCTALAAGDASLAREKFMQALPSFEAAVMESPEAAERHANLGLLYAFLGRKEEALREARRAVELTPESKDALDGAIMNCFLALTYTWTGETAQALLLLERLLKTNGATESTFYSITVPDLRKRWVWDPLRSDPRFEKLIAQP